MPMIVPFAGLDRRVVWLRLILLGGCFLGIVASLPLWTNIHTFPLVPIDPLFPILPSPWDKLLLAVMLVSLVSALFFYNVSVKIFLCTAFLAYCEDQNRGQPWFYMYWVMLWLTLLPGPIAIAACRWAISMAYVWSGIQKFNSQFFAKVPVWFVAPAMNWHFPAFIIALLRWSVGCTPFLELGIGIALWSLRFRRAAIVVTILIHCGALLFLGPLGYNYNWVVWPWNLAMIGLVCALFINYKSSATTSASPAKPYLIDLQNAFAEVRRSKLAVTILMLYSCLPILSYAGWWDSYLSFSVYSENAATANIFVSKEMADRLPPKLHALVKPFPQPFDPEFQGEFYFGYAAWSYQELHVPPMPEPRAFRAIYLALRGYAKKPGDLRMIVGQRAGPVIFYEDGKRQYLKPK